MPYLIDSDVVIDHLADVPAATMLLQQLASEGIAVSIITYMEAYQGVLRSPHQTRARKKFEAFLETVPVLPGRNTKQRTGLPWFHLFADYFCDNIKLVPFFLGDGRNCHGSYGSGIYSNSSPFLKTGHFYFGECGHFYSGVIFGDNGLILETP